MSDHVISVCSVGQISGFSVGCSCEALLLLSENLITLAELNDLAHEHIEAVERGALPSPKGYGERPMEVGTPFSRLTDESRGGDFTYG